MENKNNKKRLILSILGVFILIVAITGITFAFFNYTRTGVANTIQVGRIYFTTSQNNTINLSNVFPVRSSNLATDVGNHDTVTINI